MHTADIFVQNDGLLAAMAVEVTFNWKPRVFNVIPARAFTTETYALNRFAIHFDSIAPGEKVSIHIMSLNQELPVMTAVRAQNCVGKSIPLAPNRVMPGWFNVSVLLLTMVGAAALIYWATSAVVTLRGLTPNEAHTAARGQTVPAATATTTTTITTIQGNPH